MAAARTLSTGQVAKRLGVDRETVRRWLKAKPPKLQGFPTPGGHWRVPASELDAALERARAS